MHNKHIYNLFTVEQAHGEINRLWAMVKPSVAAGKKLTLELREYDDDKTAAQRRYYHGYVLKQIAEKARPAGEKHHLRVWKEHFRRSFLGVDGNKRVTVTNPITGKKSRRLVRISTESLGVKAYGALIEKVAAFATVELGVCFTETIETWVDTETGEVYGL
jgi:hypothetical protein